MDKTIKRQWVKALRSGEYRQTRGAMVRRNSFCCLGVLADIQGCPREKLNEQNGNDPDSPPRGYGAGLSKKQKQTLVRMNDGWGGDVGKPVRKHSFKEIADYVEKRL